MKKEPFFGLIYFSIFLQNEILWFSVIFLCVKNVKEFLMKCNGIKLFRRQNSEYVSYMKFFDFVELFFHELCVRSWKVMSSKLKLYLEFGAWSLTTNDNIRVDISNIDNLRN